MDILGSREMGQQEATKIQDHQIRSSLRFQNPQSEVRKSGSIATVAKRMVPWRNKNIHLCDQAKSI